MQFLNIALAVFTVTASIEASPLAERQDPLPNADCCGCSLAHEGYVCRVPEPGGCFTLPIGCPFNADPATQVQCCCCDLSEQAVICKPVAKDAGCVCTLAKCPFNWNPSFLPVEA
ncbi:uncharacterized protein CTRU02_202596 [Colletotrichum truncatum]|uniref:Uncharacterized protein n=1 Tax=Colletotrichum truncatum TaxID=5467 RepID=A0ACC3ZKS1_COLTU|nr:uncharacterized protein CTRU02_01765 [Colletotrichum truncatum]KAF6800086.1 hypothetical protein CTRU02_01765 [Colletotrichum truncatum]